MFDVGKYMKWLKRKRSKTSEGERSAGWRLPLYKYEQSSEVRK